MYLPKVADVLYPPKEQTKQKRDADFSDLIS